MPKAPSTEDVEILRTRCFPYDRIPMLFGLQFCTSAEEDKIWRFDVMETPDFLRNVIDALVCLRWRNTPLTMAYPWAVEGPLADAKIKVLLTSVIALEAGMTVVPRKEFYKKEPPIVLRPKVGIAADVQYHGRPRRLKVRTPWTIWHCDEDDAVVSIVIFQLSWAITQRNYPAVLHISEQYTEPERPSTKMHASRELLQMPNNIPLGIKDGSILAKFDTAEFEAPVPRETLEDCTIYLSRPLPISYGTPALCDLGEARLRIDRQQGDIMPDVYRAPEVILDMSWDYKVDIWNVEMVIWDLFEHRRLFRARNPEERATAKEPLFDPWLMHGLFE
ncbi:uncharacterized protein P174DRAFT_419371 [Aspergillus novofumigatus IBT 16806]|uniref:Protein kinase domain-containing protein n=1 Tax=Aspergillus novofumigatus (strain IBT 16806) TaxID=1392255 RepID=A0A2I1CCU1_ASPN1|nr:uncharacterized protein P174DRAFT_419371 [Aspergillus novofumigatus IBT 16806]PKX95434.1 hypothetical protein P174DRAFT_419371 [Aspergillus novofumigatus IBT 16806]